MLCSTGRGVAAVNRFLETLHSDFLVRRPGFKRGFAFLDRSTHGSGQHDLPLATNAYPLPAVAEFAVSPKSPCRGWRVSGSAQFQETISSARRRGHYVSTTQSGDAAYASGRARKRVVSLRSILPRRSQSRTRIVAVSAQPPH
jgi:hypothetical protein